MLPDDPPPSRHCKRGNGTAWVFGVGAALTLLTLVVLLATQPVHDGGPAFGPGSHQGGAGRPAGG